jgi:hypothetical protein
VLVSVAFVLAIVVLIGMLGRQSIDDVREWWSRLGAWVGIYATASLALSATAVYGPQLVRWGIAQHPWTSLTVGTGWVGAVITGLAAAQSRWTSGTSQNTARSTRKAFTEAVAIVMPFLFIAGC